MSESEFTPEAERLAAFVDQWHFETFHGSIVARDTEVWNLVYAAKENLKQRLAAEFLDDRSSRPNSLTHALAKRR